MHEFTAVASLVRTLRQRFEERDAACVITVHVRVGGGCSDTSVRQAFRMLTAGTALERAVLVVDEAPQSLPCPCGHTQPVTHEALTGWMMCCPACQRINEVACAQAVALVDVVVDEARPSSVS